MHEKQTLIPPKWVRYGKQTLRYAVLIFLAFIFFMPFFWMVTTALKGRDVIFINPPQWLPNPAHWENFAEIFKRMPMFSYVRNTLIVSLLPVFGQLFSAPMIAYSLTKVPWKGAKYAFPIILATMMIPWQVTQIPMFATWAKLGLVNTFVPMTLPSFFGWAYYIYLTRQFVKGLPDSVIEAARIDGLNEFQIFIRMFIPMMKPTYASAATITFMNAWNAYLWPKVIMQTNEAITMPMLVANTMGGYVIDYGVVMAAVTICSLPTVIIFFCLQKSFTNAVAGAVK